ncbi:uncharacterized protein LOC134856149, partial [Symsagittifera roscoffensis]|uniref:uncharacterized protein LOC134856149 n=1 Tax=Symsagittifera roscoffensis TaxID=84072 RepID=UPI00307B371C
NWQAAIYDLNEIVKYDASHFDARLYRGRCYFQLGNWARALEDISAAIHLNPNDPSPFYYRACLLRKQYPKAALQDFSVSLLLDDSYDNRHSFLHRGILYMALDRHEDALVDFASVLQLDKNLACAHCNIGVVHLTRTEYFDRAVKHFSDAVKSEPNYTRAYICRAQAYEKMKNYKQALLDFTRAIHMSPNNHHLWVYRGKVLLLMGRTKEAAAAVEQTSKVADMKQVAIQQQSMIYGFLRDHNKTVAALQQTARMKPTGPVLFLLGKAQMKAGLLHEAIKNFNQALEVMLPWHHKQKMPKETADVYLSLGMAHLEVGQNQQALNALNQAIHIKPKNPEIR